MTLANATTFSDNARLRQVGMRFKPRRWPSSRARRGHPHAVLQHAAMALGGLSEGVTPLDMAHATRLSTGGKLVYGSLSPGQSDKSLPVPGTVGIERIDKVDGKKERAVVLDDARRCQQSARPQGPHAEISGTLSSMLQNVVKARQPRPARRSPTSWSPADRYDEDYGEPVRGLDEGVHRRRWVATPTSFSR